MMPKVSILIPVFNRETMLERAVASVLNQSYANIEIVLVDDGSTDNSFAVMSQYKHDDRFVLLSHDSNQGIAVARNTLKNNATGEFVMFLDSDDELAEDSISILLETLFSINPPVDYVAATNFDCGLGRPTETVFLQSGRYDDLACPHGDVCRIIKRDILERHDFLAGTNGLEWEYYSRSLSGHAWYFLNEPCVLVHTEHDERVSGSVGSPASTCSLFGPIVDTRPEYFVERVELWGLQNNIPGLVELFQSQGQFQRANILTTVGEKNGLYQNIPPARSTIYSSQIIAKNNMWLVERVPKFKQLVVRVLRKLKLKPPHYSDED